MMLLIRRNFLLSTVNGFIAKNVLRFIQIFLHIHVWIHGIHACARNVFGFRRRNVRVPTVLCFVAPLHVLIITKNHVSLEGVTFRQNATRRLDVNCVQRLSNVNEETFIAVVYMYVGFVKNVFDHLCYMQP